MSHPSQVSWQDFIEHHKCLHTRDSRGISHSISLHAPVKSCTTPMIIKAQNFCRDLGRFRKFIDEPSVTITMPNASEDLEIRTSFTFQEKVRGTRHTFNQFNQANIALSHRIQIKYYLGYFHFCPAPTRPARHQYSNVLQLITIDNIKIPENKNNTFCEIFHDHPLAPKIYSHIIQRIRDFGASVLGSQARVQSLEESRISFIEC